MHFGQIVPPDRAPAVCAKLLPPSVHGVAALAHCAYANPGLADLLARLHREPSGPDERAAVMLDQAWALALHSQAGEAAAMQQQALDTCQVYRVAPGPVPRSAHPLRVLALLAPGTLMVNTPLDFITRYLDVRLDLLFVRPGQPLPEQIPEHDVAFFAVSECEPDLLRRLQLVYRSWPRPVLNDPTAILRLSRDGLARAIANVRGLYTPPAARVTRDALVAHLSGSPRVALLNAGCPVLVRPTNSHAGAGLKKVEGDDQLAAYLTSSTAADLFLTRYIDYRSPDGLFRKLRVAFTDRRPFLCHQASSPHWMVHYLNAGMADHPERRADEARAMAEFDDSFACRHASAFAALCDWTGLDYFQIDCAELLDGRLLVFEAAVAGNRSSDGSA